MDATFRDLIAETFAMLWHEGAVTTDGVTADCDAVADAILAMPEIQALRVLALDLVRDLADELNTPTRKVLAMKDVPELVSAWLLGD